MANAPAEQSMFKRPEPPDTAFDYTAYRRSADQGLMLSPRSPEDITILLVEDEPAVRDMIARALRREGYQIVDASDGVEAIDLFNLHPLAEVHLLITDMDMPRLGGLDLASQLRAANLVQRVIYMTGDIFRSPPSELTSTLLRKPFNLQHLTSVVREMLAH